MWDKPLSLSATAVAGKTTDLQQLLHEGRGTALAERAIYMSFDDDRLADIDAAQLDFLRTDAD